MKKNIRKPILVAACMALTLIVACDQREDPKEVAEDHNDAKFEGDKEKDASFLVDAASLSMEELQLSELAAARATNAQVKDLANMIHMDHKKSLDELRALAMKKSVTLPTSLTADGQDHYNKLSEKTGADFDKKFCTMMTDGHKDAIQKFEDASNK